MKIVSQNKLYKLVSFSQNDFNSAFNKIAHDFGNIFQTSKRGNPEVNRLDAEYKIKDLMWQILCEETNGFVYFVYDKNNLPISVAVYTGSNRNLHLEIVATREDYKSMGFASYLCLKSFSDLANNYDINKITATVNESNHRSIALQESIMKDDKIGCNIDYEYDRVGYTYTIHGLVNAPTMEE